MIVSLDSRFKTKEKIMPDKEYYREKLMKNIKAIQKYCPDFTMTEKQINEMLSDDRIRMHEKVQNYQPVTVNERMNHREETAKKYTPLSDRDISFVSGFKRNYYHVVRDEKTQEDIEYNKRMFTNLTRDDELGETVRNNYVVECMNSVFRLDLNKFKPDTPFEELLDYSVENSDIGGIAMENEHMLNSGAYIDIKDKKRAHDICQFGNTVGGYMRDLPLYVKAESFLTFPIEYLNDEQYKIIGEAVNDKGEGSLLKETGMVLDDLLKVVGVEKSRRELPADMEQFEKDYGDKKLFTVEDIEYKEPDKNKRIGGGYLSRKNTILEGIEYLLNAEYPIKSKNINDMRAALATIKTLLTEEKYLEDEKKLTAAAAEFRKAGKALHMFRRMPEIAGSNEPAVKDLMNKAVTEMQTLNLFGSPGSLKDQITYYKADKERFARPNELLQELNQMMAPFNTVNEFWEKETLTSGDIYELRAKMAEVLQAVRPLADYPTMAPVKTKIESQLKAMNRAVPGMTLEKVLAGRARELDMTGHKFKTVGNVMSSRMMMTVTGEDGSRQKGFFTKKSGFDTEEAKRELKEKLHAKYPNDTELVNSSVDFYYSDPGNRAKDAFRAEHLNLSKIADDILADCEETATAYFTAKGETLGMILNPDDKARIDSRNVAMSDVAALIGAEDVIAKSTPMVLYDNGVRVEGTFMETAQGEDIEHLHKRSPFMNVQPDCLDYSPALRQLADMQVLDYICGNMDRHAGNLFYQFDKNGKITGVTGIDNDASFARGTRLANANFTDLNAMKYVSKSVTDKLATVTPEMLRASLAGNDLVEEDIESAVDRLNLMKNAISEGKIQVMDDAEFANHKLVDFLVPTESDMNKPENERVYRTSTLKVIKQKIKNVIEMKPEERRAIEEKPDKEPGKENVLDLFEAMDKTQLVQDIEPVDAKLQQLEDAGQYVHFGSTEFNNVKSSLKRVNDANRLISTNDKLASKKTYEMMRAAYEKVVRDCQSYIARKEKQGKIKDGVLQVEETSKTGKRIVAVRSVLEFCKNKVKSLEKSLNPHNIDKTAAKNQKEKDETLAEGMMEGLDPKMAGDILKELNALSSNVNATSDEKIFAAKQIKTIFRYMDENGLDRKKCGLEVQDMLDAQNTVKAGRREYEKMHNEVPQQKPVALEEPEKQMDIEKK